MEFAEQSKNPPAGKWRTWVSDLKAVRPPPSYIFGHSPYSSAACEVLG